MCSDKKAIPTFRTDCSNFNILPAAISHSSIPRAEHYSGERGYATLPEATRAFEDLRIAVIDGSVDPSQPVFRQDLED